MVGKRLLPSVSTGTGERCIKSETEDCDGTGMIIYELICVALGVIIVAYTVGMKWYKKKKQQDLNDKL